MAEGPKIVLPRPVLVVLNITAAVSEELEPSLFSSPGCGSDCDCVGVLVLTVI